ncbi:MAG: hypothetical protein P4M07_15685 [Xanthobacteraceae bacterium]|nr:hypothetical protein [Xanthobacteraceae bacterium]
MRRISLLCTAAGLVATALAVATPVKADPFRVIRWDGTGFCQVWDEGIPTQPWPSDYRVMTKPVHTFAAALAVKDHMLRHHHCTF